MYTNEDDISVMKTSMYLVTSITKSCTFEPSLKKNFVSNYQKELISQMNIAGQLKSFRVKPVI